MDAEMVMRNVQIILAPVVLLTGCVILGQASLGRYPTINDRLRALARSSGPGACAASDRQTTPGSR